MCKITCGIQCTQRMKERNKKKYLNISLSRVFSHFILHNKLYFLFCASRNSKNNIINICEYNIFRLPFASIRRSARLFVYYSTLYIHIVQVRLRDSVSFVALRLFGSPRSLNSVLGIVIGGLPISSDPISPDLFLFCLFAHISSSHDAIVWRRSEPLSRPRFQHCNFTRSQES